MASSVVAARITEAHRVQQARVGAQMVLQMQQIWPLLDPTNLDGSFDRWFGTARPLIAANQAESSRIAANYLRVFKQVEMAGGSAAPISLAERLAAEQAATSLLVTGPVRIKNAMSVGVPLAQAAETAMATSSASAMRLALDGGRTTLMRSIAKDKQAVRWSRVTSAKPCSFCAMLAGRGAVYKSDTVQFEAHDHCMCSAEPAYR